MIRPFLILLISILPAVILASDSTIQILGIGNSFTQNAAQYLPDIIKSSPEVEADIALAVIGGCSLDKHVALAKAHEANPEAGNKYNFFVNRSKIKGGASLQEILQDREWDYITIQQVSTKSYKIETYYPYAGELISYIRQYAPSAEIVIHETWSHSIDSYRFKKWGLHPDDMFARLHAAYGQIGNEYSLRIIPVGTAFQKAKKHPLWNYQPTEMDVSMLSYPEDKENLPDESRSLHRIHFWIKDKQTGNMRVHNDGYHAGKYGEYLGGLVWYEFFFNQDAREITYRPKGFTDEQAISLRKVAHDTILQTNTAEVIPAGAVLFDKESEFVDNP
ncbi:DUF4886 domain-containing protein [Coraliomargarita parva]|uniref:DUF4886 domain-containing protein n=1 Tax=Coraliomargarita parva TaxID=3014050 RepID=UPI0022B42242|nr:DUF4886 domain-containing protein [Coraliomargarita parva]